MTTSLYDYSIPALTLGLTNLSTLLDKAATYAEAHKLDGKVVADARMIIDMFPLKRQVQIACDTAKGAAGRLAGIELPKYDDVESTLPELQTRIQKTLAFIDGIKKEQFVGAETREIVLQFPSITMKFTGHSYVTKFVLPNFYFHVMAVYSILRQNGIEVGKNDYLGNIQ
ncbi:MAG: DUF1993 domain-containing protein [Pseudomonadota bacterium]